MANGNNTFVYKPVSDADRKLAILLPANTPKGATVRIVDANGNVVSEGRSVGDTNQGRETFRFDRPGSGYGSNFSVQISAGDDAYTIPIEQGGRRYTSQGLSGERLSATTQGDVNFGETAQGSQFVIPSGADFSGISPANIDYESAVNYAYGVGEVNKDIYFGNISGEQAKQTALDLVGTDIQGIKMGAEELGPVVREAGRQDVQENIQRAGEIDRFNLSRIPGMNEFNISQARRATQEAQKTREEAVEGAGLNFRDRMNSLLDSLDTQLQGKLPDEMDKMLTEESRNRAAELAGVTGVSSLSGSGVRASDRLMIAERLGLRSEALELYPNVLNQAQQTLQAPEERAPTIYAQPTGVPLTVSNIQDRIPVQSNLSAGQTQKALGTEATSLQTISPTTLLGQNIQTQQFNETARYKHEWGVTEQEQNAQNAVETAYQNAINADKQDEVRQDALDAYYAGLEQREASQEAEAAGREEGLEEGKEKAKPPTATQTVTSPDGTKTVTYSDGSVTKTTTAPDGTITTTQIKAPAQQRASINSEDPGVVQQVVQGAEVLSTVAQGGAATADALFALGEKIFGDGDGTATIGNTTITKGQFTEFVNHALNGLTGEGTTTTTTTQDGTPTSYNGKDVVGYDTNEYTGEVEGYVLEDGTRVSTTETELYANTQQAEPSAFQKVTQAFEEAGIDWKTLGQTAATIEGWSDMSNSERLQSAGNIGTDILENQGVLDAATADQIRTVTDALSILSNPNATDAQKISAMGNAVKDVTMTPYTGDINDPKTIAGKPVVGSVAMEDGSAGYQVLNDDGSVGTVSRQDLVNTSNMGSAISAFSVLMSDATDEQKLTALTAIGIDAAQANGIISQAAAGNTLAALSIFNTAQNWDKMNNFQRGVSVLKTGNAVLQTASSLTSSATSTGAAATTTGTAATSTGAAATTTGATSATTSGASSAGTAGSTTSTLGSALEYAGPVIALAAAAYSSYESMEYSKKTPKSQSEGDIYKSQIASGVGAGVAIGSLFSPIGSVIGGVIGAAAGGITAAIITNVGTGKGSGQAQRDSWRQNMESAKFLDNPEGTSEFNVTLADGTKYDIGKDGVETKLQNKSGTNPDGTPATRYTFDVDWSNDAAVASIPQAHIFAMATGLDPTTNEGKDLFHRASAQALNAATSNANDVESINANFKAMMDQAGVDPRGLALNVEVLRAQNKISDQEYGVYIDGINKIYGTQIEPSDRQEAFEFIVNTIKSKGDNVAEYDKKLLETLEDPNQLTSWDRARRKRSKQEVVRLYKYDDKVMSYEEFRGNPRNRRQAKEITRSGGMSDTEYDRMIAEYMTARRYQRQRSSGRRV